MFVKISEKGLDDLDKKLAAKEKQLQAAEERWDDFADKKFPKQIKGINKELDKVSKTFEKITKSQEEWVKSTTKGGKEQKKTLEGLLGQFQKIQQAVDKINKSGINLSGQLKGGDELSKQLDTLQKQVDNLRKNPDITIRTKLEGADEVIQKLQQIGEITAELRDQEVVIKVRTEGDQDVLKALQGIQDKKREIGDTPLEITADTSQLDQANADLERTRTQLQGVQSEADNTSSSFSRMSSDAEATSSSLSNVGDTGESSMKRISASFSDTDKTARVLGRGIGGDDRDSIRGSVNRMNADARAANALPTLLGDVGQQLTKFRTIAVGIAAATLPIMLTAAAAATGGIAALGAAAGALTTSLGVGLAGAAASVVTAMGLSRVSILATSQAAQAAIGNITGLGKGFFAFSTQLKSVEKETKAFNELLGQLPAGSDAAAAAQERLRQSQEKQQAITELQTEWWNKYGTAAVEAAASIDKIQIALVETVNTAGGELIPILQDFLDIGVKLTPTIDTAFQILVKGVDAGTQGLREFLEGDGGFRNLQNLIIAVGKAAEPTFGILSNGFIIALQVATPFAFKALEILNTLYKLSDAAAQWATSTEGMTQIAAALQKVWEWSDKALDSIGNLVVALGNIGAAFIASGLADTMLDKFVALTQHIRDATAAAGEADSGFQRWLTSVEPIVDAAARAIGEIWNQLLHVIDAVTTATNPNTGMPIIVDILDAIAAAAGPVAEAFIHEFEQIGPILVNLIPQLAEFFNVFFTSTPALKAFLELVSTLLGYFQTLDPATQAVVAQIVSLSILFGPLAVKIFGAVSAATRLYSTFKLIGAVNVATNLLAAGTAAETTGTKMATASGKASIFLGFLRLIAAFAAAAIIIEIIANFDYSAAKAAWDQSIAEAQAAGTSAGDGYSDAAAAAMVAGFSGVPLLGPFLAWIDANIATPFDNWLGTWDPVDGMVDRITALMQGGAAPLETQGQQWGAAIARGMGYANPEIVAAAVSWGKSAVEGVKSQSAAISETGHSLGQWLLEKFRGTAPEVQAAGSEVGGAAVTGVTEKQGAMGQAGESTGDAYTHGVESGMIPASAVASTESEKTAEATKTGLSTIPGTVEQIMSGIPEETLIAWQNATAYAANATAEMTRVITHNLEAIDNNVQVILGQAIESIQTKMEEMAAAAQEGVDAVNAAFESGFSVSVSDYITPMIDEGIAEFERFASEGPAALQVGIDAITEALNTLYTDSLASYITPMVDEIVTELERLATEAQTTVDTMATDLNTSFSTLQTDISTTITTMVTDVTTQITDLSTQMVTQITDMATQVTTALTDMSTQITTIVTDMSTQVTTAITDMATQITTTFTDLVTQVQDLWQQLYDRLVELTTNLYNELTRIIGDMATWIEQRISNMINSITSIWSSWTQFLVSSSATASTSVVSNFGNMAVGVESYVQRMIAAIQRLNAAMNSIGGMRAGGIIAPAIGRGLAPAGGLLGRAKGGVDDEAEVQGGTGGVSSGLAPRVVYGEQERRTKEAYIVEDRPDNLPYLAEAASWFNMQLVPGMARGGFLVPGMASGGIGSLYKDVAHQPPPPEPVDSAASQSTVSGTSGATGTAGTTGTKKPSRRQRRRQRRRDRRAQSRSAATTSTGTTPSSGATAGAPSAAGTSSPTSSGSTPSMGTPADTGTGSPSQQAFPSACGNLYPVASPTESGQVPYRDAALSQSGMVAAQAGVSVDHVNAPADMTHPGTGENCGMPGQGSPPSLPYNSTGLGGPGAATIPYNQCLPAHVTGMQTGGLTGGEAGGAAYPIDWAEVPLGYWSSGLGYGWFGSPSEDWPTLFPPTGWDPSAWYYTGAPSSAGGMARGGILKGGVRHFQGGGLNTWQLQAGLDAASGALGSPYSYEHAGDDGGFDCSGLWQYIYTAVRDGAPTPDYRWWGTYDWAGGYPGGEGVPGPIEGAMNVYTDLTGWEGDDTHTSGDIMGSTFEAIFSGVSATSSAAGNDGIWSIGDPSSIGQWGPVTPDYTVDPSAMMSDQVSSWWLCQAPTAPDIGTAPMYGPVENWMASLPGMTEPYLQAAGQESIGTLGSGSGFPGTTGATNSTPSGGWGGGTRDWIIAALEATGMDTTESSISALETLIACESGGDQSAVSPDGAMGLTQLMPDTWSQFNIGGEVWDPIANIAASINYQLSRYGGLVDFCPYEKGGFAMGPQLQLKGESSRELTVPLDDRSMAAVAQRSLGIEGMSETFEEGFNHLSSRIDNVASRVDHQTRVTPPAVAGAMDSRIESNPGTHRALGVYEEVSAVRELYRGSTH